MFQLLSVFLTVLAPERNVALDGKKFKLVHDMLRVCGTNQNAKKEIKGREKEQGKTKLRISCKY
jgi:hypothetical protein